MRHTMFAGLVALTLSLALGGCGTGGNGADTAGSGSLFVGSIAPTPIPGAVATPFTITGANHLSLTQPVGSTVTVRFTATTSTPFAGGTSATADVVGTVFDATSITGTSPLAVVSSTVTAFVTVTLNSGLSAMSATPIATFEGLTVTDVSPSPVASEIPTAFTLTGSGFGPVAGTATVRFFVPVGTPFLGETVSFIDVPGVIDSSMQISGTTPVAGARLAIAAYAMVTLPSSATGSSTGPVLTFDPPSLTAIAPLLIDAETPTAMTLTGTGFGPAAGAATVRFLATAGTPFAGGTASSLAVAGTLTNATTATCVSPLFGLSNKHQPIVQLDFPSGARATLLSPSFTAEVAPDAVDDAYNGIGNVSFIQPVLGGVVQSNDSDPDGDAISVSAFDATSANGGSITMAADGSFTYDPPVGYTGMDTFAYTLTDGFLTDSATVTMTVADLVWFVDEDATVAGDGHLTSPFDTLASFMAAAVDSAGDYIYLHSAGSPYAGNLVLKDGQQLIGAGVALTVGATPVLPAGTRPTLVESAAGVTLTTAANNTIRGLNLGSSNGQALLASAAGACAISDMDVTSTAAGATGIALSFDGGAFDVSLGAVSVTNGATGLAFSGGSTGAVQVTGTTATSGTGIGLSCDAGALPALTFNDLTCSGGDRGILMGASTGGSLNVTGTLVVDGPALDAVQITGATIPVTFADLELSDCGEHGIDRISHTAAMSCGGGVIDNPDDMGIHCLTCSGALSLVGLTISETGNAAVPNQAAHGVLIDDCTGTITINLCLFKDMNDNGPSLGSDNNGIQVDCADGGTIPSLQITTCDFEGTETATFGSTMDHGVRIALDGGSDITDCDITGCTGIDLQRGFVEVLLDVDDSGDACDIDDLAISGNGTTLVPLEAQGDIIEVRVQGSSDLASFAISNNILADHGTGLSRGYGILLDVGQFGLGTSSTATATGTIANNDIDDIGDGGIDRGIELLMQDAGTAVIAITGNSVDGCAGEAVSVRCFDDSTTNVTISSNLLGLSSSNDTAGTGLALQVRSNFEVTALTLCANIFSNNTGLESLGMDRSSGAFSLLNLGAGTFTAAQVDAFLLSLNTGTAASVGTGYTQCTTISTP